MDAVEAEEPDVLLTKAPRFEVAPSVGGEQTERIDLAGRAFVPRLGRVVDFEPAVRGECGSDGLQQRGVDAVCVHLDLRDVAYGCGDLRRGAVDDRTLVKVSVLAQCPQSDQKRDALA